MKRKRSILEKDPGEYLRKRRKIQNQYDEEIRKLKEKKLMTVKEHDFSSLHNDEIGVVFVDEEENEDGLFGKRAIIDFEYEVKYREKSLDNIDNFTPLNLSFKPKTTDNTVVVTLTGQPVITYNEDIIKEKEAIAKIGVVNQMEYVQKIDEIQNKQAERILKRKQTINEELSKTNLMDCISEETLKALMLKQIKYGGWKTKIFEEKKQSWLNYVTYKGEVSVEKYAMFKDKNYDN